MNNKNKKINNFGFTLVEILFAVSIFVVISIVLTSFAKNIWTYNSFISAKLDGIDVARNTLKKMVAEIRTAQQAETGAYVISQATETAFSFYSDINNDGLKEKVRYFLNNGAMQKGVIKPTGSPYTYNAGSEVLTTVASYVTNSTIFYYYDENYDGTTQPLTLPTNVASIRLIKIVLTIDKNSNIAPGPMTTSTQVSIRNLKDNL